MNSPSLSEFVGGARKARRIRFGDLRRLQRDILLGRIASREEVELLIELDAAVDTADRDWGCFLVGAVRDLVVWGEEPVGIVDAKKAEWLSRVLSRGDLTKTGRRLDREIRRLQHTPSL